MSTTIPPDVEVAYKRLVERTESEEICAEALRSQNTRGMIETVAEQVVRARMELARAWADYLRICAEAGVDPTDVAPALHARSPMVRRLPHPAVGVPEAPGVGE
ncbi:hypothetical protein C0Z10_01405 [Acidipropionibacterium jensenii]|uniref:Uncharacterized protein n=1 Tax=Acidipropionibacterium jensenii TaxID=1749 RepID=A0A3Q9UCC0_9ACTN|nr:hypothetical protein [Acidipropionibacterium jensenii]AZZ38625.1 hypothetical protein C0Z10_01405 [Acidipropionibacterium jensenii]